jgi:hypothetical protein
VLPPRPSRLHGQRRSNEAFGNENGNETPAISPETSDPLGDIGNRPSPSPGLRRRR